MDGVELLLSVQGVADNGGMAALVDLEPGLVADGIAVARQVGAHEHAEVSERLLAI